MSPWPGLTATCMFTSCSKSSSRYQKLREWVHRHTAAGSFAPGLRSNAQAEDLRDRHDRGRFRLHLVIDHKGLRRTSVSLKRDVLMAARRSIQPLDGPVPRVECESCAQEQGRGEGFTAEIFMPRSLRCRCMACKRKKAVGQWLSQSIFSLVRSWHGERCLGRTEEVRLRCRRGRAAAA